MKTLVLAVAVGLLMGCSQTSLIHPDLKAFDAYCANTHLRYEAWSLGGNVFITAWPESRKWYVPDGYLSDWRDHKAGYWIEYAPTLKEAADHILEDVQLAKPRRLRAQTSGIVDIGAR